MISNASSKPVDVVAARVVSRGEHFDVNFTEDRPKHRLTFDYPPPAVSGMPEQAIDYQGRRCGRLVACYFHHAVVRSGNRTKAIWVCRCDCGHYEFRQPARWIRKRIESDCCEICLREREMITQTGVPLRLSKKSAPDRLLRWLDAMRAIGLSDDEIGSLRRAATISTKGKTAEEIRAEINACSPHAQG